MHLNTRTLLKTTASNPAVDRISSSVHCRLLTIQLGDGTNLSKIKAPRSRLCCSAILLPKQTLTFCGCFLRTEQNDRKSIQRPMLIPAEVRRAPTFISFKTNIQDSILLMSSEYKIFHSSVGACKKKLGYEISYNIYIRFTDFILN